MKYGIYYAYWEKEWGGQFVPYVEKCKKLGFDVLEVACGAFHLENDQFFKELRAAADANGMILTGGYGPRPEHNLASKDEAAVEKAFGFYADIFRKMEIAGIDRIGGALYSYWRSQASTASAALCTPTGPLTSVLPWTRKAIPCVPSPACSVWPTWLQTTALPWAWSP